MMATQFSHNSFLYSKYIIRKGNGTFVSSAYLKLQSFFILIPGAARHRAPLKRQETCDCPYTGSGISMICRAFSNAVFQICTHIKLLCRCMHQAPYVHFLPSYHLSARSYTHSFPEDPCLLLYFDTSLHSQAPSLLKDGNV